MLSKAIRRDDKDVNRKDKLFAYSSANGIAALWPIIQGFENDEEVDVAVVAGVAAGVTAEEDDLFGIEAFGDQSGNGTNRGLVDFDLAHEDQVLYRKFYSGYYWRSY